MALTKYVSAEWVEPTFEGGTRSIKAIGDDGLEYWLPGDTPETYDVPPWPDFTRSEEGKSFLAPPAKSKAK
jgi:hypothetical protein